MLKRPRFKIPGASMSRRNHTLFDDLVELASKLPWWVAASLALVAFVWLFSIASMGVAPDSRLNALSTLMGPARFNKLVSIGQFVLPLGLLLLAGVSVYGRKRRSALRETLLIGPERGELNAMSWKQFEAVVSEAFRRKGYSVTKLGGNVGGVSDLVLKKAGETFLVHCKQWRAIKVGVNALHELNASIAEKSATAGFVVTSGVFTDEAKLLARESNIELLDGKALHVLTRRVNLPARLFKDTLSVMTMSAPFCPECQGRMAKRHVKEGVDAGKFYWRCRRYPECKGKRPGS